MRLAKKPNSRKFIPAKFPILPIRESYLQKPHVLDNSRSFPPAEVSSLDM